MKIRTEKRRYGNVVSIYGLDTIFNRESAMRWIINASQMIPFEKKSIRVEDGESFHDGTISFVCSEIKDADSFINDYLNSEIYSIMISGYLAGAHITVQAHLNLQNIYVGYDEGATRTIEELEQLLGLV